MNKLTDAEIEKAIECCAMGSYAACRVCPYHKQYNNHNCITKRNDDIKDLIKRKDTEIERLTVENLKMVASIKNLKSEAIKELREKCIEHQDFHKGEDGKFRGYIAIEDLDYIVEELEVRS